MTPDLAARIVGVGIDVGMTYTGAAAYRRDYVMGDVLDIPISGYVGESKFPSEVFVPRDPHRPVAVGKAARDQAALSDEGKTGLLYSLFKLRLGTTWSDDNAGRPVMAQSLTADILRVTHEHITRFLNQPGLAGRPARYAFSHPGVWEERKLNDFEETIKAQFGPDYRLIEEPVATALAAAGPVRWDNVLVPGSVMLVCDLGGGTLDLALVAVEPSGAIAVKAGVGGDTEIGMSNLDKILGLLMMRSARLELTDRAEALLKKHLVRGPAVNAAWQSIEPLHPHWWRSQLLRRSETKKVDVCKFWEELQEFGELLPTDQQARFTRDEVRPFVERMNDEIRRAVSTYLRDAEVSHAVTPTSITHIVISGGGSGLPGIRATLEQLLPGRSITHIAADRAPSMVQRGAAMFAFNPDLIQSRRFNRSYGILVSDTSKPTSTTDLSGWPVRDLIQHGTQVRCYDKFQPIFRRHTPVLSKNKEYTFPSVRDNEGVVVFEILCGEQENPKGHESLKTLRVPIPPGQQAGYPVKLRFTPLPTGRMRIDAYDPLTGEQATTELDGFTDPPML